MDKATKLRVLRRALALIKHPQGWTEGSWVEGEGITLHHEHGAYDVGRKKLAGTNEPKVRCCVQGGCYIAAGELGVPFDDVEPLLDELDEHAGELYGYESAMEVNDEEGQDAVVEVLEHTIKHAEVR